MSSYWASDDGKVQVKTLESYLRDALREKIIDHAVRASLDKFGNVQFYIHPVNANGETLDYKITNNSVWPAHDAFCKPDEKLIMFIAHDKGRLFKADAMTWYINMLERLRTAVEEHDKSEAEKILAAIHDAEDEI